MEKQHKWIQRKAKLEMNGCKVIEMTCCRWRKMLKFIRRNPPKTEIGRVLCYDNQEILHLNLYIVQNVKRYNNCTKCKTIQGYIIEGN